MKKMAMFLKAVTSRGILTSISTKYGNIVPYVPTLAARYCSTSKQNDENYDIIITGGGMVGTTLACAIG